MELKTIIQKSKDYHKDAREMVRDHLVGRGILYSRDKKDCYLLAKDLKIEDIDTIKEVIGFIEGQTVENDLFVRQLKERWSDYEDLKDKEKE